jgi:ribosomal protein L37AE/L43A
MTDELPEVCKDCPENYYCSLRPDIWQCEKIEVKIERG